MFKGLTRSLKKVFPDPLEAIKSALCKVPLSDEEKNQAKSIMEKIKDHSPELQEIIQKISSERKSLLTTGWRPFIGWICGFALANVFVLNPLLQCIFGIQGPELSLDLMIDLVATLLGLGTLRTVEKMSGKVQ